jgi:hypothetical protein
MLDILSALFSPSDSLFPVCGVRSAAPVPMARRAWLGAHERLVVRDDGFAYSPSHQDYYPYILKRSDAVYWRIKVLAMKPNEVHPLIALTQFRQRDIGESPSLRLRN